MASVLPLSISSPKLSLNSENTPKCLNSLGKFLLDKGNSHCLFSSIQLLIIRRL